MIEFALRQRLRHAVAVAALAGRVGGEAAIDIGERKSNEPSAFPAAVQTVLDAGRLYDQDGPDATRKGLFRFETFALSADTLATFTDAIADELELAPPEPINEVLFKRGTVFALRNGGVETLGDLTIHRRILDMQITAKF